MDSKIVPAQVPSAVLAVVIVVGASVVPFQARAQAVSLDPVSSTHRSCESATAEAGLGAWACLREGEWNLGELGLFRGFRQSTGYGASGLQRCADAKRMERRH